jgi:hypothetical protein
MERGEIIDVLKGMCERCLIKGIISTLEGAKEIYDVFDRFSTNNYKNDEEYSDDILYLYNLAVKLHKSGNTLLEESYSIYNAILCADNVDFVETDKHNDDSIITQKPVELKSINDDITQKPVKNKRSKKVKDEDTGVIDISDISL